MALTGTDAYTGVDGLPALVSDALAAARSHRFPYSCRPEQGRLLHALAGGATARIGETGTGLGVGLAWLGSGAAPGCGRTAWSGPCDLLVLGRGGQGKVPGDEPADVERLLAPGGTVVVDDSTPATGRPPPHDGDVDRARLHGLEHPALRAAELRLAADLSTVVGTGFLV
ncbi:SAM-dependent methyltransferase [Streptomyces sp. NPDC054783]